MSERASAARVDLPEGGDLDDEAVEGRLERASDPDPASSPPGETTSSGSIASADGNPAALDGGLWRSRFGREVRILCPMDSLGAPPFVVVGSSSAMSPGY